MKVEAAEALAKSIPAADLERVARAEDRMAADDEQRAEYEEFRGRDGAEWRERSAAARRRARATRLQMETGAPYCLCHALPFRDCPAGENAVYVYPD